MAKKINEEMQPRQGLSTQFISLKTKIMAPVSLVWDHRTIRAGWAELSWPLIQLYIHISMHICIIYVYRNTDICTDIYIYMCIPQHKSKIRSENGTNWPETDYFSKNHFLAILCQFWPHFENIHIPSINRGKWCWKWQKLGRNWFFPK